MLIKQVFIGSIVILKITQQFTCFMVQANNPQAGEPWIGIDLGTTNTSVGLWTNGRVEILQNDAGMTTTPSVVQFKSFDEIVIGATALN